MNQKNNVIKKYDFERYEVLLPYRYLSGRRKRKFLFNELEKMHPCFSDDFCFDSDFKGLTRKGIASDVFVINKRKLAEYEEKRNFQGAGFILEEQKNKKHFFVSSKMKSVIAGSVLCIVLAITGIIFSSAACFDQKEEIKKEDFTEGKANALTKENYAFEEGGAEAGELGASFFEAVKLAGGSLNSLKWGFDGFKETISASVKNVYPEELSSISEWKMNGQSIQLSYKGEEPVMSVDYQRKTFTGKGKNNNAYKSDYSGFCHKMRTVLKENNCLMVSEQVHPYCVVFQLSSLSGTIANKLFEKISELLAQNAYGVSKVMIEPNGVDEVSFTIMVEESLEKGLDLLLIKNNLSLFVVQKNAEKPNRNPAEKRPKAADKVFETKNNAENSYKKIGVINEKNGNVITFYKGLDGKLIRKMEDKNVK